MNLLDRIRTGFLKIAGYLVPLLQPVPGLGFWAGFMVVPLIMILIPMFVFLPYSILAFFFYPGPRYPGSLLPLTRAFVIVGFLMLVYSTAYLRIRRKEGLVTSGPYRLVRHPQYLGIILSTLGFTSWSYWFLTHLIFHSEFLDAKGTIVLWFIELFAYILLAYIEEIYLSRKYGEPFENYKNQVPLFMPFLKTNRKSLEIPISILIPALLLFVLIIVQV